MLGMPVATVKTIAFWAFVIAFAIKVPDLAVPHLAAGRAHRSADRWLDDPGGRAAEAGRVRFPAAGAAALSGGGEDISPGRWPSWRRPPLSLARSLPSVRRTSSGWWPIPRSTTWALWCWVSPRRPMAAGTADAHIALNGAILQMFNHGLSAAGMFFLVGVIYERTHTRNLEDFGGLFPLVPIYGGILIFTSMASLGLPGLNGFVSEFLVVRGAWPDPARSTPPSPCSACCSPARTSSKASRRCCMVR